jgi:hypothetical protein
MSYSFVISGPVPPLESDLALYLFRITQEAVSKALKHAHAKSGRWQWRLFAAGAPTEPAGSVDWE